VAAEEALRGAEPSEEAMKEAGRLAAEAAEPLSDNRGSADYKRSLVRVFTERGLRTAIAAAQAGGDGQ
jgi:carbon-monoxide dehydrogenase medium subunit